MRVTTEDIKEVARVLMDDSVFPFTCDDGSPSKADFPMWPLLEDKRFYILMPNPDCVAVIFPMNHVTYDYHFSALKPSRGAIAINAARQTFQYMFYETVCAKLVCQVPDHLSRAYNFYLDLEMEIEGINTKSFLKNGILRDQTIFGLTKEKFQCLGAQ